MTSFWQSLEFKSPYNSFCEFRFVNDSAEPKTISIFVRMNESPGS